MPVLGSRSGPGVSTARRLGVGGGAHVHGGVGAAPARSPANIASADAALDSASNNISAGECDPLRPSPPDVAPLPLSRGGSSRERLSDGINCRSVLEAPRK